MPDSLSSRSTGAHGHQWVVINRYHVTEADRAAVARWYGKPGMATLREVRAFLRRYGTDGLESAHDAS